MAKQGLGERLGLKAGDWVEVRSAEEIVATLDERGCFENVPFMQEMFQFCGQRIQVDKRADKTCDPAYAPWTIRRLEDTVHLRASRCDGSEHGGCQAGCLIFWKEAWLKRSTAQSLSSLEAGTRTSRRLPVLSNSVRPGTGDGGETHYFCQATEVRKFTSFMKWWDPRQYIRDIRSGNVELAPAGPSKTAAVLLSVLRVLKVVQAFVINAAWQKRGILYPAIDGRLDKTPSEVLDLHPGEFVQVRTREEIVATLDRTNRNRGLLFDVEMVPYCGGIYRVNRRVTRIIDEKTGKMATMKYPCIVLDGVVCKSHYHRLCPRAIPSYWREGWLRRVEITEERREVERDATPACHDVLSC